VTFDPNTFEPQPALALIAEIEADLDRLKRLILPQSAEFDPKDARNKLPDGKLTARGVEICYRLFEIGRTRYAVSQAMGISFGAADHRLAAWKKAGGSSRPKMRLD